MDWIETVFDDTIQTNNFAADYQRESYK